MSWRDQPHSHRAIYRVPERPATLPQIYLPCPGKTSHTPTELSAVSWTDQPLSPTDLLERPATLSQIYVLNRPATLPRIYVLKRPVPLPQIYLPCPGETSHTPTDLSNHVLDRPATLPQIGTWKEHATRYQTEAPPVTDNHCPDQRAKHANISHYLHPQRPFHTDRS